VGAGAGADEPLVAAPDGGLGAPPAAVGGLGAEGAGAEDAEGGVGAAGAGADAASGALGASLAELSPLSTSDAFKFTRTVSFFKGTAEVLVIGFGGFGFGASSLIVLIVLGIGFTRHILDCVKKLTLEFPPVSNPLP
jgi:hypothetical protein